MTHACSHVKCAKVNRFSSCARCARSRVGGGSELSILLDEAVEEDAAEDGAEEDMCSYGHRYFTYRARVAFFLSSCGRWAIAERERRCWSGESGRLGASGCVGLGWSDGTECGRAASGSTLAETGLTFLVPFVVESSYRVQNLESEVSCCSSVASLRFVIILGATDCKFGPLEQFYRNTRFSDTLDKIGKHNTVQYELSFSLRDIDKVS